MKVGKPKHGLLQGRGCSKPSGTEKFPAGGWGGGGPAIRKYIERRDESTVKRKIREEGKNALEIMLIKGYIRNFRISFSIGRRASHTHCREAFS